MPKVPQQTGPTQTLQVVRQPRARAVNLGPSPFAEPLKEAALVVDDIYQRKVKADSSDALLKYERDVQSLLYAQGEGYTYLRGKDAVDRSQDVLKKLDDLKRKYADSLEIPEAQQAFLRAAEAHALRYRKQILTHADKESRFYQASVLDAEVNNAVTNASLFYGDPENILIEKQRGLEAVNEALQLQGLDSDPDIVLSRRQKFLDSFHASAIEAAIELNDLDGAERLLKSVGKEMTPKVRLNLKKRVQELRKSLEDKTRLERAQSAVDALFDPQNKSLLEMETEARKKYSGEMENLVINDLRSRYRTWDSEVKEERLNLYNDAFDSVRSGISPDHIPLEVRDRLTPAQKLELDRVYEKYYGKKDEEKSKEPFTDTEAANIRALQALYRMTPDEVEKIDDLVEFFQAFGGDYKGANKAVTYYKEVLRSSRTGHKEPPKLHKLVDTAWKHPSIGNAVKTIMAPLDAERTRLMKRRSPSASDLAELDQRIANRRMTLRAMLALAIESTPEDQLDEQRYEQIANNLIREFQKDDDQALLDEIPPAIIPQLVRELRDRFGDKFGGMLTVPILVRAFKIKKLMRDEGITEEEAVARLSGGGD